MANCLSQEETAIREVSILEIEALFLTNPLFHQRLGKETLNSVIKAQQKCYRTPEQLTQAGTLYSQYIHQLQNARGNLDSSQCDLSFWSRLGEAFKKLQYKIHLKNVKKMKGLESVLKGLKIFLGSEMTAERIFEMVESLKQGACKEEIQFFQWFYVLLEIACQELEQKGIDRWKVGEFIEEVLEKLHRKYVINFQLQKSRIFQPGSGQFPFLSLKNISTPDKRQFLTDFILKNAHQAEQDLPSLTKLLQNSYCREGIGLEISTRLKGKDDKDGIDQIIEQLYRKQIMQEKKNKKIMVNSVWGSYEEEKKQYEIVLKGIIERSTHVRFDIVDLVRAKCLFHTAQMVEECVKNIQEKVKELGYQIIYKVRGKCVTLLIKVGGTLCELVLGTEQDYIDRFIANKIDQIIQSPFYECVNFILFQKQTYADQFIHELTNTIEYNNQTMTKKQQRELFKEHYPTHCLEDFRTFQSMKQQWDELKQILVSYPSQIHQPSITLNSEQNDDIVNPSTKSRGDYFARNGIFQASRQCHHLSIKNYQNCIRSENSLKETKGFNLWFEIGRQLRIVEKYQEGVKMLKESLEKNAEKITDFFRSEINREIGHCYLGLDDLGGALDYYQQSLSIQKSMEKIPIETVSLLVQIGQIHVKMRQNEKALICFQESLQIQEKFQGHISMKVATILKRIGQTQNSLENLQSAILSLNQSQQIIQTIKGRYSTQVISVLTSKGQIYCKRNNYEQALKYFKQSLEIQQLHKEDYPIVIAETLKNIGRIHKEVKNYEEGLLCFKEELKILEEIKGEKCLEVAEVQDRIGQLYFLMNEPEEALVLFNRSLQIKTELQKADSEDMIPTLQNIGLFYLQLKKYEEALPLYKKSLSIKQQSGKDAIEKITTLKNIGLIHFNLQHYPQALQIYQQAKNIMEEYSTKETHVSASLLEDIGSTLNLMGKHLQAISSYNSALEIRQNLDGKFSINNVEVMKSMGKIYYSMNRFQQALSIYQFILAIEQTYTQSESTQTVSTQKMISLLSYLISFEKSTLITTEETVQFF